MGILSEHKDFLIFETERVVIFARLVELLDSRKDFLQCLITPADIPDGTEKVPFDPERKPADVTETWSDLGISTNVALGTRLQYVVDVYDGPYGNGYILNACVFYDFDTWKYREHHGPENRNATFDLWMKQSKEIDENG